MISSDDALFGHAAFRYAGAAPRMWWWAQSMGLRKFQEMVFTGRPFTADEMAECGFVNSVVPRDQLEAEVQKYALGLRPEPLDRRDLHAEDLLRDDEAVPGRVHGQPDQRDARVDGDLREARRHEDMDTNEAIDQGLTKAVKDFDSRFPPEWRLSKKGRASRRR